jgi:cytidine deaminase
MVCHASLRGKSMIVKCLALLGPPGAGKSTSSRCLETLCRARGIAFRLIKLADPLYRCQAAVYEAAGCPLADFYAQDGELLNFLGSHLRRLNPTVLIDDFEQRLQRELQAFQSAQGTGALIVCDDMRPSEADYLRSRGFAFLRLDAPTTLCAERRRTRGDITLGAADHVTERGLDTTPADHVVPNTGTVEYLQIELGRLIDGLVT